MKSKNDKDILISKSEIKSILKKKIINSKIKALKLNIKAFNISNYKNNLLFNSIINKSIQRITQKSDYYCN